MMKDTHSKMAFLPLFIFSFFWGFSQEKQVVSEIFKQYEDYKESHLKERRITHSNLQPLINRWKNNPEVEVQKVGESIEGRDLFLLSLGTGEKDVFLWSQMHGDESTATMAIFDLLNFFADDSFTSEKQELLNEIKLHFLPMLNPDGAESFQRRNALGIDVNRDALRLQSPEGKTLKRIRDSLDADFGFNLHDQSRYYNAEGSSNPATISFLAPAYNYEKEVNEVRGNAMKLIVGMNEQLQRNIPGNVAKYNDDFEPRAFGDNIQKWGTSTILIESGGYPKDPEKQEIRKMNFLAILTALFSIANEDYQDKELVDYQNIPQNDSKLFDLKLTGLKYDLLGDSYILDLGINHGEIASEGDEKFFYRGRITDQGDLSTNYGYETIDASGFKIVPGKVFPEVQENMEALKKLDFAALLEQGYAYVKLRNIPKGKSFTKFPLHVVGLNFEAPQILQPGINPTFFLKKEGHPGYALINGFIYLMKGANPADLIKNALIFR